MPLIANEDSAAPTSDYDTFNDLMQATDSTMADPDATKISSSRFYSEYHGHPMPDLERLLPRLRETSDTIIWTAGDSSLDNKHWFPDSQPAVPGTAYEDLLQPPRSICDVTYWLNKLSASSSTTTTSTRRMAAINTAVEATTLNERTFRLRPQDEFIQNNISSNDILVVSVGGNDVALKPTPCTIINMLGLLHCVPTTCMENYTISCGTVPFDDCCYGCACSSLSCTCSFPPCAGYFNHLFGKRVESYIHKLIRKTKPRMVLVCMIYYPDEHVVPSWANLALGALGYNSNPQKLQLMIHNTYQHATRNISLTNNNNNNVPPPLVIPIPLFHVLDGKRSEDYVARVEPSARGGKKMAEFILDAIHQHESTTTRTHHYYNNNNSGGGNSNNNNNDAPTTAYMQDRS